MNSKLWTCAAAALLVFAVACSTTKTKTNANPTNSNGAIALPTFGPGETYAPAYNAADFSADVTNPWFPLTPGTTNIYTGTKDGKSARNLFQPTTDTKVINGVICRVVYDILYLDGKLAEKTYDYYSQDKAGNVWYFGEDTATYKNGKVDSTDGTWHTGVGGAQPGVFMQADRTGGARFRQEYYKGQAEDTFKALSLSASITVPYGSFTGSLQTEETTSLEPDVVDNKYYVKGIGEVQEAAVKGDTEKLVLTEIKKA